ncbi:MAG: hypothetical protein ABIT38_12625, partial [Gemmatimonadaceae bacterium]
MSRIIAPATHHDAEHAHKSYVLTDESVHSSMPELDDVEVDLLSVVPEGDATIPEVPSAYH